MKGEDADVITTAMEDLMRASHKLAEKVYSQHQGAQSGERARTAAPGRAGIERRCGATTTSSTPTSR